MANSSNEKVPWFSTDRQTTCKYHGGLYYQNLEIKFDITLLNSYGFKTTTVYNCHLISCQDE